MIKVIHGSTHEIIYGRPCTPHTRHARFAENRWSRIHAPIHATHAPGMHGFPPSYKEGEPCAPSLDKLTGRRR